MTHTEIERDDVVERYLLRRLSALEEAEFEEHYLWCQECRERLVEDRHVVGMLAKGCAAWVRTPLRPRWWLVRAPAWGLAAALGAAAVYVSVVLPPSFVRNPQSRPVEIAALRLPVVELTVYRAGGGEAGRAKVGQPFVLGLDTRGLAAASDYTLEIVGESGGQVWSRPAVRLEGERAEVQIPASLPAGLHWVRLSREGRLAREYELRVEP